MHTLTMVGVFVGTTLLILGAIELGYFWGTRSHKRSEDEKEGSVSAMTGAVLGIMAFILAFTFAIVSGRYDARKELVRDEANAVRTTFLRADFLPPADRTASVALLEEYVELRLNAVNSDDLEVVQAAVLRSVELQDQLWNIAVANSKLDLNSDVAALYIESLNQIFEVHALRVVMGLQQRIPTSIWVALLALIVLGMIGIGYQTAIAGSRRSWAALLMSLAFALIITLIWLLDRPSSGYLPVPQAPLENVRRYMEQYD